MKKLAILLTIFMIFLPVTANSQISSFLSFENFYQNIKCIKNPDDDFISCSNYEIPDNEDVPEIQNEPVIDKNLNSDRWFEPYTEIDIASQYWHEIAQETDIFGKPWWFLGIMEVADFDQNGLSDIILHSTQSKSRNHLDPDVCKTKCLTDYGYDYYTELWNDSWDAIVVLLQTADGNFVIGNRQLFGKDTIGFGNAPRKAVVADVNQDGYPDYLPSGAWEDGRPLLKEDPTDWRSTNNWEAPQKIMISNGDGTYRIEDLDIITYGHAVTTAKMQNGDIDLIYNSESVETRYWRDPDLYTYPKPGSGHMPAQVRTWYHDVQEKVTNYPFLRKWEFRTSKPEKIDDVIYSRYLVVHDPDFLNWVKDDIDNMSWCTWSSCRDTPVGYTYNHPKNKKRQWGFKLYEQINSQWIEIDTLQLAEQHSKTVKFYDMSDRSLAGNERPINELPVMDFGDTYGVGIVASDSCTMKLYPDGNHIFIYYTDGGLRNIPKDVQQPIDFENYMGSIDYLALEIKDGKLFELHNVFPEGPDDSTSSTRFHCGEDINGDGYEDMYSVSTNIWYKASAEKNLGPEFVVWLNDQNGSLIKTPVQVDDTTDLMKDINGMNKMPYESHNFNGTEMVIRDINGDGIGDLIQAGPGNGSAADHGNRNSLIRISFGVKPQQIN